MISTHLILCQRVLWVVHHLLHPCLHPVWIIFDLFWSGKLSLSPRSYSGWKWLLSFQRTVESQLRSREQHNPLNELPSHLHTFALHQFWATEFQTHINAHSPSHPLVSIFFFSFFTCPPSRLHQFFIFFFLLALQAVSTSFVKNTELEIHLQLKKELLNSPCL